MKRPPKGSQRPSGNVSGGVKRSNRSLNTKQAAKRRTKRQAGGTKFSGSR